MASAAEQLAANFNFGNLGKAHELRSRIFFTLGALIVARLGTYIPMPGIDPAAIAQQLQQRLRNHRAVPHDSLGGRGRRGGGSGSGGGGGSGSEGGRGARQQEERAQQEKASAKEEEEAGARSCCSGSRSGVGG